MKCEHGTDGCLGIGEKHWCETATRRTAPALAMGFTVHGPPVPKGRPRKGAGGRMYTPDKTRAYEDHVRALSLGGVARYRWKLSREARYGVTLRLYFAGARRVDLDNVCKCLLDGMMPFVLCDDSQVDELHVYRLADEESPRAEVEVIELAR